MTMPDQILHELKTERGTYRLVNPREGFAYIIRMSDGEKLGEIHRHLAAWAGVIYMAVSAGTLCDIGALFHQFEATNLARA
jgi:hypothetical protein